MRKSVQQTVKAIIRTKRCALTATACGTVSKTGTAQWLSLRGNHLQQLRMISQILYLMRVPLHLRCQLVSCGLKWSTLGVWLKTFPADRWMLNVSNVISTTPVCMGWQWMLHAGPSTTSVRYETFEFEKIFTFLDYPYLKKYFCMFGRAPESLRKQWHVLIVTRHLLQIMFATWWATATQQQTHFRDIVQTAPLKGI